ncbi:MAG: family 10 glycosylhydrolase [Candidatus Hydrogenedentes bacterium]|nr:family 10 glycosylhydrolase [Candidatus Hydrogenedentota bacterium]
MITILALSCIALAADNPILIFNEDDSHFFGSRKAEDMTIEGLHAFVDQYAGTKITHLFLNPNAMRASFASSTREPIWDLGKQIIPDNEFAKAWIDNAKLLYERGLDPYAIWIARSREKGISPWISMRMNDVHEVSDTTSYLHSTFWRDNPQFWRVPNEEKRGWQDRALDFAHPEVREHAMAFVRELLERYDMDGLELDWMRFGYHFAPGKEREGVEILNQFTREVRALTREWREKRGHPIQLAARVPAHPDAAVGLGMDGVTWAREGLIDLLIPTPFWASADFDIPVELWKERLGDATAKVKVAPGLEILLGAYPGAKQITNDLASVRGFASGAWARGADAIYLFNFLDPAPMVDGMGAYRELLEKGLDAELVKNSPRRYVVTYRDTVPAGVSNNAQLPADVENKPTLRIYTGPANEGASADLVLGLVADTAGIKVTVGGQPCAFAGIEPAPANIAGATHIARYAMPAKPESAGYLIFLLQPEKEGATLRAVWAELQVREK